MTKRGRDALTKADTNMRRNKQANISGTRNLMILRELAASGPSGMSAEHVANVSGLSRPSTFRALEELHAYGIVEKSGSIWRVATRNPYVVKAVELLDAERYLVLEERVRGEIGEVVRQADGYYGENKYAMIAFGSAVGERPEEAEDIDILIVVDETGDFTATTRQMKVSLSFLSLDDIDEQWTGGEHFVQEAIARGLLVRDPLEKLARLRVSRSREFDREKALDSYLGQYKREYDLAGQAYSSKNWEQAAFHQNKAAAALARIWLLGVGVRPRSRPELADQLGKLCSRLRNQYMHLTGEIPDDEDHAEERERELWAFRTSTSHLSDSTVEFSNILGLLHDNDRGAVRAIKAFLTERGLQALPARGDTDLEVRDPDGRGLLKIEVKSSASKIGAIAIQPELDRHASEDGRLVLLYNPHRNLPADERTYEVSHRVKENAAKAGVCLVPSNAFFSWACDVIEENLKGKAVLDSLMELCGTNLPAAQTAPEENPPEEG